MERKRGAIDFTFGRVIGWAIALLVLALLLIGAGILYFKGGNALEFIKNIFTFGRPT